MPYVIEDVISADIAEESAVKLADLERYAVTTTVAPAERQDLLLTSVFFVSAGLNIINLYGLIFSTRMRLEGIRWHALYCCIMNFLLLWCYANFTRNQPFFNFSPNILWKAHADPIQIIGFTAYPASLCFLIPLYLVTFISKRLRTSFICKWMLPLIFHVILIIFQYYLITSYYNSINQDDLSVAKGHPILHFHYYICLMASLLWVFMLLFAIFSTLYYGFKAIARKRKGSGVRLKDVYSLYGVLFYASIVIWCHMPKQSVLLMRYMQEVYIPTHPQRIDAEKLAMANQMFSSSLLPAFVNAIPVTYGLIPAVEYLAGSVCFQSFRETFLQLLSCGTLYDTPADGSIWNIYRRLNRVRTASASNNKKENSPTGHVVAMDAKIKPDVEVIT